MCWGPPLPASLILPPGNGSFHLRGDTGEHQQRTGTLGVPPLLPTGEAGIIDAFAVTIDKFPKKLVSFVALRFAGVGLIEDEARQLPLTEDCGAGAAPMNCWTLRPTVPLWKGLGWLQCILLPPRFRFQPRTLSFLPAH